MSDQEIDVRRAAVLAEKDLHCKRALAADRSRCIKSGVCNCLFRARDIRLSDEAAGYITAKLETLESAKERRG